MKKETIELIEKIKIDLQACMSDFRYNHSINVMNKAIELATHYGEDEDEAALAGITHDIAKEISFEDSIKMAEENGIEIDEIEKKNSKLIHGKIGALVVKQKYGFGERIQKAIEYHTETNPNMDMLAKIIYVADKIEDSRDPNVKGIEEERRLAFEDIDKTIIYIIDATIIKLIQDGKLIHPVELVTRNKLLMDKQNDE